MFLRYFISKFFIITVIWPVYCFKLTNTSECLGYMKTIRTKLGEAGKSEEEIKEFETGAQKFAKNTILANFKDWEFYTGESMNPDGM